MFFIGDIKDKFSRAFTSLISARLGNISPVEAYVDQNPRLFAGYEKNKLMIVSGLDSYYNYRYGVSQLGYYSPFSIHVYVPEIADYLIDKINNGYTLVALKQEPIDPLEQLNESQKMKDLGLQFKLTDHGNLIEIGLVKSTNAQ